ncbi:MAG TPA: hypothetical protein VKA21_16950, partial [Candidatus Binatia bacterium]|nr:hypothetical protein [Candidatus Binatia bacterium]
SCLRSDGAGPDVRRLAREEHGGGKGRGMSGAHRPDGLFVFAGAGIPAAGGLPPAEIVDVLPTLLALAGLPVPGGFDGRPIPGVLASAPAFSSDVVEDGPPALRPYDARETGELAARLAALGYLEPEA